MVFMPCGYKVKSPHFRLCECEAQILDLYSLSNIKTPVINLKMVFQPTNMPWFIDLLVDDQDFFFSLIS